jgi:hypothetical protein
VHLCIVRFMFFPKRFWLLLPCELNFLSHSHFAPHLPPTITMVAAAISLACTHSLIFFHSLDIAKRQQQQAHYHHRCVGESEIKKAQNYYYWARKTARTGTLSALVEAIKLWECDWQTGKKKLKAEMSKFSVQSTLTPQLDGGDCVFPVVAAAAAALGEMTVCTYSVKSNKIDV